MAAVVNVILQTLARGGRWVRDNLLSEVRRNAWLFAQADYEYARVGLLAQLYAEYASDPVDPDTSMIMRAEKRYADGSNDCLLFWSAFLNKRNTDANLTVVEFLARFEPYSRLQPRQPRPSRRR